MTFLWIIVVIIVVWILASRSKKLPPSSSSVGLEKEESGASITTEEMVFKSEAYFDKKIIEDINLPDAIRGSSVYVYRNLMKSWYRKLSGQYRYNDKITQQLRSDWMNYMWAVEEGATSWYLYMETSEETHPEKAKSYSEKADIAHKKTIAIEDGFSALVGENAIVELENIRQKSFFKFDKFGNLAPEGFIYNLTGELKEEKIEDDIDLN